MMDPFYLGIPAGPAIPPIEGSGLKRINREQPHDQNPQRREQHHEDELEEDEEFEELEPLDTYDDHGRLLDHHPHELEVGDEGLPSPAEDGGELLPAVAEIPEEPAETPAPLPPVAPGDRRRPRPGDGHIDISV